MHPIINYFYSYFCLVSIIFKYFILMIKLKFYGKKTFFSGKSVHDLNRIASNLIKKRYDFVGKHIILCKKKCWEPLLLYRADTIYIECFNYLFYYCFIIVLWICYYYCCWICYHYWSHCAMKIKQNYVKEHQVREQIAKMTVQHQRFLFENKKKRIKIENRESLECRSFFFQILY